jgi:hypothetical protein
MKTRSASLLAACLALLVTAATAVTARAAAGEGVRLGPTVLLPVLSVEETYDSNIHLTSVRPEECWTTTVSPSLNLLLPIRRFYLNAEGGLAYNYYSGIEQEDTTDWYYGGAVGADFPGGLSFKVDDRQEQKFLIGTQEYGVELAPGEPGSGLLYILNGEDYLVNTLNARAAYAVRDTLKFELSGTRSAQDYSVSNDRDRVEGTVRGDVFWKFRPRTSAFVEGSYHDYAYDTNVAQDNNATQVALGVTWDVTAKSTGIVRGGYEWKRYEENSVVNGTEDGEYYTVQVGVKHSFTPRTVFNMDISRGSQESDFPRNPYFIRNTIDVSLMQRLSPKFYGRVSGRYGLEEYPNFASFDNPFAPLGAPPQTGVREDTGYAWSVALGYDLTQWLSFKAEYGMGQRNSNFDTFDYDVTRFTVGAKAAF